jgi:hypothetical protein
VSLLVRAVRERLQATIRYYLEESMKTVCAAVLEITAAAVLAEFKRRLLDRSLVEMLGQKFSNPAGEMAPLPVAEATGFAAVVLAIIGIVEQFGPLLAF